MRLAGFGLSGLVIAALAGCTPDYSPNTYSNVAVQQANKVDRGMVIGFREVKISDDGTIGTVTGGAAGGILGAETDSPVVPTALTALGATVVGGIVGATIQHTTGDTTGWEYIVREPNGDLVSVTQREPKPIPVGQRVLVIEGKQARIVPDYSSTALELPPTAAPDKAKPGAKPAPAATSSSTVTATSVTATSVTSASPAAPAATLATPAVAPSVAAPASPAPATPASAPAAASSASSAPAAASAPPAAPTPAAAAPPASQPAPTSAAAPATASPSP